MEKCIDVYVGQGVINWREVYNSGCKYAIIKATQGHGVGQSTKNLFCFTDGKFVPNIQNAFAAGVKCGVYHYMTARTIAEANQEADYFLSVIKPYKDKIELWAALDVEDPTYLSPLSKGVLTTVTKHFLKRIEDAGYFAMLYTNPNYLLNKFEKNAFATGYDIWLAHYGVSQPYSAPNMKIWQYGIGKQSGVTGNCDLNYIYGEPTKRKVTPVYKVGGKYTMKKGDKYSNGVSVPKSLIGKIYTISAVKNDRILLKEIYSWVKV